jgi:hypothetical protein
MMTPRLHPGHHTVGNFFLARKYERTTDFGFCDTSPP